MARSSAIYVWCYGDDAVLIAATVRHELVRKVKEHLDSGMSTHTYVMRVPDGSAGWVWCKLTPQDFVAGLPFPKEAPK